VKLRPGQNIEYVITNAEAHVPNDHVRAYALWEGWFGYDRKKYAAMLREALEPFVLCVPKRAEPVLLSDSISEDDLSVFLCSPAWWYHSPERRIHCQTPSGERKIPEQILRRRSAIPSKKSSAQGKCEQLRYRVLICTSSLEGHKLN